MAFPNTIVHMFMKPDAAVDKVAPAIMRAYGISYLLLPFNIYATYYFQSIMQPKISMAISVLRGLIVSGVLIIVLPIIFGPGSIWFSMLITEIAIALFSVYYMRKCNRELY